VNCEEINIVLVYSDQTNADKYYARFKANETELDGRIKITSLIQDRCI